MVVDERDPLRDGTDLERVEHVADERRPGRHDLVAGIERGDGEMADDRVRAGAGDHVRRLDAVALRDRVAQVERAAVGVAVERAGAVFERLERGRERAPRAFVRGQLDDPREPELALHFFLRLPRLVRNEAVEGRTEEAHRAATRPRAKRQLVVRALAPEPEDADDGGDGRGDRGLVRPHRPFDPARHRLACLVLHHRLGTHPGEPAEERVAPVEHAHRREANSTRPWPIRPCPGDCPWDMADNGQAVSRRPGAKRPFRGLRDSGSASADPESCDGKKRAAPSAARGRLWEKGRGRRAARPLCGDEGTSLAIEMPPLAETLRGSKTFVATSARAPVFCSADGSRGRARRGRPP